MSNSEITPRTTKLDEAAAAVITLLPHHVARYGWVMPALKGAAAEAGVDPDTLAAAIPGGMREAALRFSAMGDERALEELGPVGEGERIRERITRGVETRLRVDREHRPAQRSLAAFCLRPSGFGLARTMSWRTADRLWIWAGDQATDYNHYTKRAILSGVYLSTLTILLGERGPRAEERARAFLDRRIDNVMQFEKLKARVSRRFAGGAG